MLANYLKTGTRRTWGANGPLAPATYFNGGQFTIGTSPFGGNG